MMCDGGPKHGSAFSDLFNVPAKFFVYNFSFPLKETQDLQRK